MRLPGPAAFGNLRGRVVTLLLVGILGAGVVLYAMLVFLTREWLLQELVHRARALSTQLAARIETAVVVADIAELRRELRLTAGESDVVGIAAYDMSGRPLAEAIREGKAWSAVGEASLPARTHSSAVVRSVRFRGTDLREVIAPVHRPLRDVEMFGGELGLPSAEKGTSGTALARDEQVGWVRIVLSGARLKRSVDDAIRLGVVILLLALGLGGLLITRLVRWVVRPLRDASELASEIAAGQLDRRLSVRSTDEMGALAVSMNAMAIALGEAREQTQAEQAALRKVTEAVFSIARGARAAHDVRSVFGVVANQLVRVTGCDGVALASPDPTGTNLLLTHRLPASAWPASGGDPVIEGGFGELRRAPAAPCRVALGDASPSAWSPLAAAGHRTLLVIPLSLVDDQPVALLLVSGDADAFPAAQTDTVAALSSHLSAALHAEQLRTRLEGAFRELQSTRESLLRGERLRVAGELASGVAHDINNIIGAILGRTQLLQQRLRTGALAEAELEKGLGIIERASEDAGETIRRLREYGRGSVGAGLEAVDIDATLRDSVEFTRPRLTQASPRRSKPVTVEVRSSPGLWVTGRTGEMREVFTNLLINACDALPEGGSILVESIAESDRVHVVVADDGIGMDAVVLARLFEPFYSTKGEQGTGLGMALVRSILERHGGTIDVDSAPGRGTRVHVRLPLGPAPAVGPVTPTAASDPPAEAPMRILLVDDEAEVRSVLTDIIELQGHAVAARGSAREALAEYRAGTYELVLTDLGMPDISGWDLVRDIRSVDPGVFVAVVTGWSEEISQATLERAGVNGMVSKPFSIEDVTALLRQAARHRAGGKPSAGG